MKIREKSIKHGDDLGFFPPYFWVDTQMGTHFLVRKSSQTMPDIWCFWRDFPYHSALNLSSNGTGEVVFSICSQGFCIETPDYKNAAFIFFGVSNDIYIYNVMFSGGCLCKSLFFGRDAAILCEQDDLVSGC